ncbi:hypothetical protein CI109_101769 [Kwoniella shandongensis]|uniref:Pex N-terminal domain-containing protein n=1 Tax=Kwoniella shandongensis TaxID=1734106 RepID=A0A5M6C5A8_9TREE|nr:uncharacterized protein CI109_001109 [Kwoniella shandongensis]KAA5530308.1 hypothetical protein CI109_001109 [Kwoniella shandongensis]
MGDPTQTTYPGETPAESSSGARSRARAHAPRVNQLDADELDSALVSMLSEKVGRSLDNFKSTFSMDMKPEVELVIKLLIFKYGIWDPLILSSPGARLQNLKLTSSRSSLPSRNILLLYLLLHPPIFPTYLMERIRKHAFSQQWPDLPNHDWRKKAWRVMGRVEAASRVWEAVGWGWFLWDGRYPSLLMRIMRLRLVPSQKHLTRLVSYEFMNRQLVWGAFTEFLMFSVPLLPPLPAFLTPSALVAPIKSLLSPPTSIDYTTIPLLPPSPSSSDQLKSGDKVHTGPLAGLPKATCPICHLRITSTPVPLDSSTSQGTALTLPPLSGLGEESFGHGEGDVKEESRIFVPAQTDCEGGCKWCYYCIGEELYKHRGIETSKRNGREGKKGNSKNEKDEIGSGEDRWECLRCGGGVSRAWRVGAEEASE